MPKFNRVEKTRLMLRGLLEAIREEDAVPVSEQIAIAERIEEISEMLICLDRETAIAELTGMLGHPEDYVNRYAAKRLIEMNAPEADSALARRLREGDDEVLFALVCGLAEKNLREAEAEGARIKDKRSANEISYANASLAFFRRMSAARPFSEDDIRNAEKQLVRDEEDEEPLTPSEKMRISEKIGLLVRELCRPEMRRNALGCMKPGKGRRAAVLLLVPKAGGMKN